MPTQTPQHEVVFTPNPRQWKAMCAKQKYICYGGARGGGKSYYIREKAVTMALKYPGIRICIVRRTHGEVEKNHVVPLRQILCPWYAKYNAGKYQFNFYNGSLIQCDYFNQDRDADHFQGIEYDIIFIDEATNLKEEWLKIYFDPCLRGVNDFPKHIIYTCNPGGPAHQYIKRLFVDRRFLPDENPDDYVFIPAKATDNIALMRAQPDYIKQLDKLPPKKRAAWRDGDFNVFEGQFFEDFVNDPAHYKDRRLTHVIDPFPVSKDWPVYHSFDWGYKKPFSMGWYTIDYDGRMYRILEFYGCEKQNSMSVPDTGLKWFKEKVFRKLHEMEEHHPLLRGRRIIGPADSSIWKEDGGPSIAEAAENAGVYFDLSDKERLPGWQQCHARLAFDDDGYPGFQEFKTCEDFIRTIPLLQYDEHDDEDLDSLGEDHPADEWRYMCQYRPIKPIEPEEVYIPRFGSDPLNQFA